MIMRQYSFLVVRFSWSFLRTHSRYNTYHLIPLLHGAQTGCYAASTRNAVGVGYARRLRSTRHRRHKYSMFEDVGVSDHSKDAVG